MKTESGTQENAAGKGSTTAGRGSTTAGRGSTAAGRDSTAADSPDQPFYRKEELLAARHFSGQEDLVSALLEDQETYTIAMADERISRFLKGKVN